MKTMRLAWLAAVLTFLAASPACDSGSGNDEGQDGTAEETAGEDAVAEDDAATVPEEDAAVPGEDVPATPDLPAEDTLPPEVAFGLAPYAALQAGDKVDVQCTDDGTVTSVEVLIDGAVLGALTPGQPLVIGTSVAAGIHEVAVRATDGAGNVTETTPVPAIFAGAGTFLPFTDGWKEPSIPGWGGFEKKVPQGATSVYDEKAHVTVPAGTREARAWLHWKSKTEWDMGLDIGTGNCPDSGTKLAAGDHKGKTGLIEIAYDEKGADLPAGKWFGHVRFKDGGDHDGESQQFDILFLALP